MLRLRVLALPLLTLWLTACSFITDFDRSKIDRNHSDAGDGDGDSDTDGGSADMDAGSDGSTPAPDAGGGCTGNEECSANQLCCDGTCVATSLAACTACGVACSSDLASACENRTCVCGAEQACSGSADQTYCWGPSGTFECVECRDSDDCPAGKSQCVNGACEVCKPGDANTGCTGNTPICDASTKTCRACQMTSTTDCTGDLVCTQGGACGGCNDSMADCKNPNEPICDMSSTLCRACTGNGANQECVDEQGKPYCVNSQKCSVCMPDTEMGCDATSATPDCRLDGDHHACQGCINNASCAHAGVRDSCDTTSGKCVECKGHGDCTDASKPLCGSAGLCVRCDQGGGDAQCNAKNGSVCEESNGRCVECMGDSTCPNSEPVCLNNMCVQCTTLTQALNCLDPAKPVCMNNACAACSADAQCTGTNKQCVSGQCKACDPNEATGSNGCTGLQICNPASSTCETVQCLSSADCTGDAGKPICNTTTHQCEACANDTQCDAKTDGTICATSGPNAGHCGACDPTDNGGCPAAGPNDQCSPATATCVACKNGMGCAANEVCDDAAFTCVGCLTQADCDGNLACVSKACTACTINGNECTGTSGTCVNVGTTEAPDLECRDCDPSLAGTAAGCAEGEACNPTTFTCGPMM